MALFEQQPAPSDAPDGASDSGTGDRVHEHRYPPVDRNRTLRMTIECDQAGECPGEEVRTFMDAFDDRVPSVGIDVTKDDRKPDQQCDQCRHR